MHPILEQMKSVMHHYEAFEDETLRRFKLKLVTHGHDSAANDEIYLYSLVDPTGEDFGCRAIVSKDQAWFEVFYEDNNEIGDRAYSIVVAYRPATREYSLDIESRAEGQDEVAGVLGPDYKTVQGKSMITGDTYSLFVAFMARRFAERLAGVKGG
ncbi:MAG: hypothetical protein WC551_04175 [Patescibacteria group bacterium]